MTHSINRSPLRQTPQKWLVAALLLAACAAPVCDFAGAQPGGARARAQRGSEIRLSNTVRELLDDKATPPAERRAMAIFHGQAELFGSLTPAEQAQIAFQRGDLNHPAFMNPATPRLLRARAMLTRGECHQALALLEKEDSFEAMELRAQALDLTGRHLASAQLIRAMLKRATEKEATAPREMTAVSLAIAQLSREEAGASKAIQSAMDLLSKTRNEVDKLYYPAILAQAEMLAEKNDPRRAIQTAVEALTLNPNNAQGWFLMGDVFVSIYDFSNATRCIEKLRRLCPTSPWADVLASHMYLQQKDADAALAVLMPALIRYPNFPELRAAKAASLALKYRDEDLAQELTAFAMLHPNHPMAESLVGSVLAQARQYEQAEHHLRRAIQMRPNWAAPRLELGLLLMSAAREEDALRELRKAVALDRYNQRANNQLKLVEEMLSYETITTEHFIIRYKKGIDEALARDMPTVLEEVYRDITATFQSKPRRKTLIELMPDEQWFGVRMTGMPSIWTIGASTGDLVAFTPPRQGQKQRGTFDWARVLRHEFVHTVTLDQTNNRVPHWFTEACAVSQEPGGRDFESYSLLSMAYAENKLFPLESINWAFIRPTTERDRPLAYAQAHWMFEYITATYGHDAIIKMLTLYSKGVSDADTFTLVTGRNPVVFMNEFKIWAGEQVKRWGMTKPFIDDAIKALLTADASKVSIKNLDEQLAKYPDHAELLKKRAEAALLRDQPEAAREWVMRFAAARPVDPWADKALLSLAPRTGRTADAVSSLEQLDRGEQITGDYAAQLARIYQNGRQFPAAISAAQRAVFREPYNPAFRELAAAVNMQGEKFETALHHLRALTILQPTNPLHYNRLSALLTKMGRPSEAASAAATAQRLSMPTTQPAPDTQPH